jgi:hypothetical protein
MNTVFQLFQKPILIKNKFSTMNLKSSLLGQLSAAKVAGVAPGHAAELFVL